MKWGLGDKGNWHILAPKSIDAPPLHTVLCGRRVDDRLLVEQDTPPTSAGDKHCAECLKAAQEAATPVKKLPPKQGTLF